LYLSLRSLAKRTDGGLKRGLRKNYRAEASREDQAKTKRSNQRKIRLYRRRSYTLINLLYWENCSVRWLVRRGWRGCAELEHFCKSGLQIMGYTLRRWSFPELRLWVPSPLGGEGQDEGNGREEILLTPLTFALSPQGFQG
jgi:hypothetical protein